MDIMITNISYLPLLHAALKLAENIKYGGSGIKWHTKKQSFLWSRIPLLIFKYITNNEARKRHRKEALLDKKFKTKQHNFGLFYF